MVDFITIQRDGVYTVTLYVSCSEREVPADARPAEHLLECFSVERVVGNLGQNWNGILRIDGWGSFRPQAVQWHECNPASLFRVHGLEKAGSGLVSIDDDVPQTACQGSWSTLQ